jgi:hypothetical protein
MTARSSYEGSLAGTFATKQSQDVKDVGALQTTIDAQLTVVGLTPQQSNASLVTATKAANASLLVARQAQAAKQMATIDQAKATLTATGDVGPG